MTKTVFQFLEELEQIDEVASGYKNEVYKFLDSLKGKKDEEILKNIFPFLKRAMVDGDKERIKIIKTAFKEKFPNLNIPSTLGEDTMSKNSAAKLDMFLEGIESVEVAKKPKFHSIYRLYEATDEDENGGFEEEGPGAKGQIYANQEKKNQDRWREKRDPHRVHLKKFNQHTEDELNLLRRRVLNKVMNNRIKESIYPDIKKAIDLMKSNPSIVEAVKNKDTKTLKTLIPENIRKMFTKFSEIADLPGDGALESSTKGAVTKAILHLFGGGDVSDFELKRASTYMGDPLGRKRISEDDEDDEDGEEDSDGGEDESPDTDGEEDESPDTDDEGCEDDEEQMDEASFSPQHHQAIAKILRDTDDAQEIFEKIINLFAQDNPSFNKEQFIRSVVGGMSDLVRPEKWKEFTDKRSAEHESKLKAQYARAAEHDAPQGPAYELARRKAELSNRREMDESTKTAKKVPCPAGKSGSGAAGKNLKSGTNKVPTPKVQITGDKKLLKKPTTLKGDSYPNSSVAGKKGAKK